MNLSISNRWSKSLGWVISNPPRCFRSGRNFAPQLLLTTVWCCRPVIGCLTTNSCELIIVPFRSDWNLPNPPFLTNFLSSNPFGEILKPIISNWFFVFLHKIKPFNPLLLTNCVFQSFDWKFCAHDMYPGFLFPIHTEIIQTSSFSLIFKIPIVKWEPSRYIIANIPLDPDIWPFIPNPLILYCYSFNEFFIPMHVLLHVENSWNVIANTSFVSGSWPNCSKPVSFGIATSLTNFSSPFMYCYMLRIPEILLLTLHSFQGSDHLIDNIESMLLLTQTFYSQPNCRVFIPVSYICIYCSGFVFRPDD